MLFTADGLRPAPVGEQLAGDPAVPAEHEFKLEQAEIASEPVAELGALARQLHERRVELIDSAARRGVLVAGLGTSPLAAPPTATPDERYRRMHERFGLVAGEQLTCGAHVHVSVGSRAEGVAVIDGARRWLAVLLAMSANSPYWSGRDTGYASYRSIAWGRWPTAGPTAAFGDPERYDRLVGQLVDAGAAVDPGMIYFDARLSAHYPTVEFRVADVGQRVADSVLLAALCRAPGGHRRRRARAGRAGGRCCAAAAWRAARYGLTASCWTWRRGGSARPHTCSTTCSTMLGPALRRGGDAAAVHREVDRLLAGGTGAALQRADHAARGRADDVVRAAARARRVRLSGIRWALSAASASVDPSGHER